MLRNIRPPELNSNDQNTIAFPTLCLLSISISLHICYFPDKQEFLDAAVEYMPASHRRFIHDVRHGPSVREFGEMFVKFGKYID